MMGPPAESAFVLQCWRWLKIGTAACAPEQGPLHSASNSYCDRLSEQVEHTYKAVLFP
jgi:hypothetical protein